MSAGALSGRTGSDGSGVACPQDRRARSMVAKCERIVTKVLRDLRDLPRQREFITWVLIREAKRDRPRDDVFQAAGAKVEPDVLVDAGTNPVCYVVRSLSDEARPVFAAVLNRESRRDDPRDAVIEACRERLESDGDGAESGDSE